MDAFVGNDSKLLVELGLRIERIAETIPEENELNDMSRQDLGGATLRETLEQLKRGELTA